MKRNIYFPMMLTVATLSAHAEVFKCKNAAGKIVYQPVPCSQGTVSQQVIPVEQLSPEETERAKSKLKAWKEQQAIENAAKQEAEKERRAERERQESLELQRRSVNAQEQQAIAEQQQLQQQNSGPIYIPACRYWGDNMCQPNRRWDNRHNPATPNYRYNGNTEPPGIYTPYKPYIPPPTPAFRLPSIQNRFDRQAPGYNPYQRYND